MQKELSQWISEDLKKSGLDDSTIEEMRVKEVKGKDELKDYINFASIQGQSIPQASETYLLPYPDGYNRIKLQFPIEGRKYLSPYNEKGKHVYFLESEKDKLQSSKVSIIITEGEKKTAKLTQECRKLDALTALGFPGVSMLPCAKENKIILMQDTIPYSKEEKKILMDVIQRISGRIFYIAYDSDFRTNPDVQTAIAKLTVFIAVNKGIPKLLIWEKDRGKGIDDYLVNFTNPEKELASIIEKSSDNPFKELDKISVESICHALVKIGADKDKATEIFERYELKEKFGISKKTFLSCLKESQNEQAREEKKNLGLDRNFTEKDGKTYSVKISKDGQLYLDIFADFTARFTKEIYNDDNEVSREISIYKNGKTVKIELSSDEISEIQLFRKAINKRIVVSYEAISTRQHNEFREFIEQQSQMTTAKKTKYLGKLDSHCFVADNQLVNECGLKENDEYILARNRMQIDGDKETLRKAFEMLYRILGKNYWKFIGFAIGSFFCNEIASKLGFFPILFLHGEKGSGKSRLAEILTAFFGAHREAKAFTISSTTKSLQRASAKYKSIPIRLNEYQSNQTNNTLLCSLYDREGYNRAKTDNSYDIQAGEVNASFIVLSTHNITGYKAEDVASRVIEIDTNTLNQDADAMDWLWNNRDSLSWFVVEAMKIKVTEILQAIESEEKNNRKDFLESKKEFSDRTLETHSVIQGCARFSQAIACTNIEIINTDSCIDSIENQTRETRLADVGYSFLQTLHTMTLKQEIPSTIAQITNINGRETLIFSLRNTLPLVQRFSKQADRAFADEKTLAQRLKTLGLTKQKCRDLSASQQWLWFYEISNSEE